MKIASSTISMSSQSSYVEQYTKDESLKLWVGNERPNFEGENSLTGLNSTNVKLDLSEEAKALMAKGNADASAVGDSDGYTDLSDKDKLKIQALETFLSALMRKKIKLQVPEKVKLGDDKLLVDLKGQHLEIQRQRRQGWGLEFESHESYYEKEQMSFSSDGIVKTSDGKEIKFSLDLSMKREFMFRQDISLRAGDAVKVDPLVINFNGIPSGLSSKKYSFDIDSDGIENQISFVNPGSGFLALDKNNDGNINNGSELFGPASGNGFSELAQYDSDNNNWIDENDPIFQSLRIWTKDENGKDKLFALGEKGVGAIYLGNVDTDFSLKNGSNELQGEIKKTGIFLRENGTAGTVQHIDLAI